MAAWQNLPWLVRGRREDVESKQIHERYNRRGYMRATPWLHESKTQVISCLETTNQ